MRKCYLYANLKQVWRCVYTHFGQIHSANGHFNRVAHFFVHISHLIKVARKKMRKPYETDTSFCELENGLCRFSSNSSFCTLIENVFLIEIQNPTNETLHSITAIYLNKWLFASGFFFRSINFSCKLISHMQTVLFSFGRKCEFIFGEDWRKKEFKSPIDKTHLPFVFVKQLKSNISFRLYGYDFPPRNNIKLWSFCWPNQDRPHYSNWCQFWITLLINQITSFTFWKEFIFKTNNRTIFSMDKENVRKRCVCPLKCQRNGASHDENIKLM